ncbi:hypothetical protein BgAZ_401100 [Babesia gibsoni]|uniref:Secreted antigen 1 n=1 Tax=Babesia gibsoni TaxID=33632 RepID=A0AAD8P802_BABGI|nr:hypothetical protein BgAZ_401100 [Babesia gibsoni]
MQSITDMKGLRVIRLVALWSLAVNAITPLVKGMTEGTVNTESLKPETVKDAVDLLGKLATETTLKEKFISELLNKVKEYFDIDTSPDKGYKKKLEVLLEGIPKLRVQLLETPSDFGRYSKFNDADLSAVLETSHHWLPLLHSEFWLLFFLTTSEGFGIGGNQWSNNHFGPSSTNSNLHKWLTDKLHPEARANTMKKGYTDTNLKSGGKVSAQLSANLGIEFYHAGPLTHAQKGLFLLSSDKFYHSYLASVLLFMAEFCRDMSSDKFSERSQEGNYDKIKNVCKQVSGNIDALHKEIWPLYNPEGMTEEGDDDEEPPRRSQRGILNETYKNILKKDKYTEYVQFMKDNIPNIAESLKQMHSYSSDWSVEYITTGRSHGPFRYGYIFKDKHWDSSIYFRLLKHVNDLLTVSAEGSLYSLFECLDQEKAISEKERIDRLTNPSSGRDKSTRNNGRVKRRTDGRKGDSIRESTGKVTEPTAPGLDSQPASGKVQETSNGPSEVREPVSPVDKDTTPSEGGTKDGSEEKEGDNGASEEVASEGEKGTKERTSEEPAETPKGETPTKSKSENDPRGINGDNIRLKLARSDDGPEEEAPQLSPPTPPKEPASKNGNKGPANTKNPFQDDQPPQRRRTHSQGDNATKAIREEAELPSESSFSGIHACGILIVTCIFSVV